MDRNNASMEHKSLFAMRDVSFYFDVLLIYLLLLLQQFLQPPRPTLIPL